ncbi:MAG: response regulator [Novosphingobium sp.]|nr:response regulator [Novosphingobium sp.]
MRVLIVEDEPLLAMLLEESIADLGHEPVGAAATVAQAFALLDQTPVDCALLDYSLGGDKTSIPVAERLQAERVPFTYLSGHSALDKRAGAPAGPLLNKPASMDGIARAIEAMAALTPPASYPAAPDSPA